jgi:hypothetical protein
LKFFRYFEFTALIFIFSSCGFFYDGYIRSQSQNASQTPETELIGSKTSIELVNGPGQTSRLPLQIEGGTPPYFYEITSGPGQIDSQTGIYTQPNSWNASTVRIKDAKNKFFDVTIANNPILADNTISKMLIENDDLYLFGNFKSLYPSYDPIFSIADRITGGLPDTDVLNCKNKLKILNSTNSYPETLKIWGDFIFIGGTFPGANINDQPVSGILKINYKTCEIDRTFNEKAKSLVGSVFDLAVDAGRNKLFIVGQLTSYFGSSVGNLIAIDLNTAEIDQAFSSPGNLSGFASKVIVNNSDLFIGGIFTNYRGSTVQNLAKISALNGQLDTTFTQSIGLNTPIYGVHEMLILNNSLYIATQGNGITYRGANIPHLIKVDISSGNLDAVFSDVSGFGFPEKVLSIDTDGTSIFVAGEFSSYRTVPCPRVIKVDALSGAMDTGFNWGTGATGGGGFYVTYDQTHQELYIITNGQSYNGSATSQLIRVNKDTGVIDSAFQQNFKIWNYLYDVAILPDGNIIVIYNGNFVSTNPGSVGIAKVHADQFTKDSVFNSGTGFNGQVKTAIIHGNFIYVAGAFTTYNGQPASRIAKIDKVTGALDTVFTQATGLSSTGSLSLNSLTTDGTAIYLCGFFTHYRGTAVQGIARVLISNGNLDTTFSQTSGLGSNFTAVCNSILYHNSSIYLAGNFVAYRGTSVQRLAKVHPTTGVLDTTFSHVGSGFLGNVDSVLADGSSIFVAGSFSSYRGQAAPYLVKLDQTSGNIDNAFLQTVNSNNRVQIIGFEDDHIFLAEVLNIWPVTSYRGDPVKRLFSVSKVDGSLADVFKTTDGFDYAPSTMVKRNSKYYYGGFFNEFKGKLRYNFSIIDSITGSL